jgi:hypothetical protein
MEIVVVHRDRIQYRQPFRGRIPPSQQPQLQRQRPDRVHSRFDHDQPQPQPQPQSPDDYAVIGIANVNDCVNVNANANATANVNDSTIARQNDRHVVLTMTTNRMKPHARHVHQPLLLLVVPRPLHMPSKSYHRQLFSRLS